jgi:hypothetical protein
MSKSTTVASHICPRLLPFERLNARRAMINAGQLHLDDAFAVLAEPSEAEFVCAMLCSRKCGIESMDLTTPRRGSCA